MRTTHTTTTTGFGVAVLAATAISVAFSSAVTSASGPTREYIPCEAIDLQPACGPSRLPGGAATGRPTVRTPLDDATAVEHVRRNYDLMIANMEVVGILPAVTEVWTGDAKDHPNYGQITVELADRPDAKDHPNYGPAD